MVRHLLRPSSIAGCMDTWQQAGNAITHAGALLTVWLACCAEKFDEQHTFGSRLQANLSYGNTTAGTAIYTLTDT